MVVIQVVGACSALLPVACVPAVGWHLRLPSWDRIVPERYKVTDVELLPLDRPPLAASGLGPWQSQGDAGRDTIPVPRVPGTTMMMRAVAIVTVVVASEQEPPL
jgi:hypothetical protein